jgi:hypothetical protein
MLGGQNGLRDRRYRRALAPLHWTGCTQRSPHWSMIDGELMIAPSRYEQTGGRGAVLHLARVDARSPVIICATLNEPYCRYAYKVRLSRRSVASVAVIHNST